MQNKKHTLYFFSTILFAIIFLIATGTAQETKIDNPRTFAHANRWVSSTMPDPANILRITVHDGDSVKFITEGHRDHKPVWSKQGDMITFFRATGHTDFKPFNEYRTHICVIESDGTGFKKLTDADNSNVNPTWTRDGSNKIIFNRLSKSPFEESRIFLIDPKAAMNDTVLISNPENCEWAESGLKDGRIFIFRLGLGQNGFDYSMPDTQSYFLLNPENKKYNPVKRPNKVLTYNLSLSPSETKVTYMKDLDGQIHTYSDVVIAYADFDLENLEVKNEVVISVEDSDYIDMYPRWSPDERYIVYSSSRGTGHMWGMRQYIYDLKTGKTHLISDDTFLRDMYPCFEDLPK